MTKQIITCSAIAMLLLAGCNNAPKEENSEQTPVDSVLLSKDYSPGSGTSSTDTAATSAEAEFEKNGLR